MEPLTPALVAVATLILKKAFEKTGEKLGEVVSAQAGQLGEVVSAQATHLMQLIRHKPLPQARAIEQTEQPVDVGQAIIEVETVGQSDPELKQAVDELAGSVMTDPKLAPTVAAYAEALQQAQPTTIQNYGKLAEKIGMVVQGGTGKVDSMSF